MNPSLKTNPFFLLSKNPRNAKSKSRRLSFSTVFVCLILFFLFAQNLFAEFKNIGLATKDIAEEFSRLSALKGKKIVVVGFYNSLGRDDGFAALFEDELQGDMIKKFPRQLIVRNHIETVLGELKISRQDIFDDKNRKKFGKLLSADIIISGSYRYEDGNAIVNAQAIDVETGMALGAQRVEIKWNEKDKQVYTSQKNKQKENKPNAYKGSSWIERAAWAWKTKWTAELGYKYGWEIGLEISPDYNLRAFHDAGSWILDLSFFYKWIHFSLGLGYAEGGDSYIDIDRGYGLQRAQVNRFSWVPSLHIPFVNYQNTIQFFGILGYRFEGIGYSFDNEYYRFGISGPFYGAKIRLMWKYYGDTSSYRYGRRASDESYVDFMGFDFSVENVLLIDKVDDNQPDFRIYKIAFVFTYE